ncbi:MAG: type IV pilus inner membrane component PilO [Nitrospirota bacterium]
MSAIQDKWKKLTPKQQTLLLLIIPVIIIGAFTYYIYMPGNKAISGLEADIQKNESEISKSQLMQSKLGELKAENVSLQQELKLATDRLPSPSEGAGVPDAIKKAASESGLTVKSVIAGANKTGPGGLYIETPVNVEVTGDYHDLGKLMENIDNMTRMVTVSDLDISSGKVSGIKMDLPIKFTVLAYASGGGK